jgi:cell division septation protein DedD
VRYRLWLALALAVAAAAGASTKASGQVGTSPRPTSNIDSVFARARQLVVNGNGAAGRLLLDSVVAATSPDSQTYADALYWRAALAATSADAERDYRRVIVEYPLSGHSGDALFQLAQIEAARGDRSAAALHLDRFLLENPTNTERGRAGLLLVRTSFDAGDAQHACIALGRTLTEVPSEQVELRNQLDYYSPRCASVDTTKAAGAAPTGASPSAAKDTTRRPAAAEAKGKYTLQVASYNSRVDAEKLASRLKARGFDARLVGATKVFRVRIGHYPTRAAATAAARELKAKKIDAFVTEIGAEEK